MVKWFCCSALCLNNYTTTDESGNSIRYYRLPRNDALKREYAKILETTGFNWKGGHICGKHWSCGERKNICDLPDVPVPNGMLERFKTRYDNALKLYSKKTKPTEKDRAKLRKHKRVFETALRISGQPEKAKRSCPSSRRETLPRQTKARSLGKKQLQKKLSQTECKVSALESELDNARKNMEELRKDVESKKQAMYLLEKEKDDTQSKLFELQKVVGNLRSAKFNLENLSKKPQLFSYLTGLTLDQFNILFECVAPYTHLIPYPGCNGTGERSMTKSTELMAVLTICRHSLNQGVMAFILQTSHSTMERVFNGWVLFLATVLGKVDLKPASGYILNMMPKSFIETGHGLTDIVIDATEFKFQRASNYELNTMMFSNYKNCVTGKALIGITPHGSGLLFSEIYPGSISDSELAEKAGVLTYVEEEHEVMADRGFGIQDFLSIKGVTLNRPKMKDADQFSQSDVSDNFDIAATRIHVERFIGRVRCWTILNSVWPLNRIDMLSSIWKMLCCIVNLTMSPIGPRD